MSSIWTKHILICPVCLWHHTDIILWTYWCWWMCLKEQLYLPPPPPPPATSLAWCITMCLPRSCNFLVVFWWCHFLLFIFHALFTLLTIQVVTIMIPNRKLPDWDHLPYTMFPVWWYSHAEWLLRPMGLPFACTCSSHLLVMVSNMMMWSS